MVTLASCGIVGWFVACAEAEDEATGVVEVVFDPDDDSLLHPGLNIKTEETISLAITPNARVFALVFMGLLLNRVCFQQLWWVEGGEQIKFALTRVSPSNRVAEDAIGHG